jgi:hypothetical protein
MMARILFENLLVPSVSFAPSGLLSLIGVGRTTGIVVDCGHLETSVLPVSLDTRSNRIMFICSVLCLSSSVSANPNDSDCGHEA